MTREPEREEAEREAEEWERCGVMISHRSAQVLALRYATGPYDPLSVFGNGEEVEYYQLRRRADIVVSGFVTEKIPVSLSALAAWIQENRLGINAASTADYGTVGRRRR